MPNRRSATSGQLDRLLDGRPTAVRDLVAAIHSVIQKPFPDATVSVDADNIGFARGTGYTEMVFVISPQRTWVNLGFYQGTKLPDPTRLLEGTGKLHRHVKIRTATELAQPAL